MKRRHFVRAEESSAEESSDKEREATPGFSAKKTALEAGSAEPAESAARKGDLAPPTATVTDAPVQATIQAAAEREHPSQACGHSSPNPGQLSGFADSSVSAERDQRPARDRSGPTDTDSAENDSDDSASSFSDDARDKPAFVRRKKSTNTYATSWRDREAAALSILAQEQRALQPIASNEVDDTDGLDPVAERAAWESRQRARQQRDCVNAAEGDAAAAARRPAT